MKTETQKKDSAEVKMEDPIFVTLEYYRLEESVLFQFYPPFIFSFHSPFINAGKTEDTSSGTTLLIL